MGPFQYKPKTTPLAVVQDTPKRLPSSAYESVPAKERISNTEAGVSFTRRPVFTKGLLRGRFTRWRFCTSLQVSPDAMQRTATTDIPNLRDSSGMSKVPDDIPLSTSTFSRKATSVDTDCLGTGDLRRIGLYTPWAAAWSMFSWLVTHSRLSTRLLALFRSLWFTNFLSPMLGPWKASQTKRWTSLFNRLALSREYSPTLIYPARSGDCLKIFSGCGCALPLARIKQRGRLLTLPKLLTSYRPSYPTTGFQISCSISNSFRRLLGFTNTKVTDASRTPVSLDEQALRRTHLFGLPAFSAAPGEALVGSS